MRELFSPLLNFVLQTEPKLREGGDMESLRGRTDTRTLLTLPLLSVCALGDCTSFSLSLCVRVSLYLYLFVFACADGCAGAEMCEAIVKEFNGMWREKLELVAEQCRQYFPNLEMGVEVLKLVCFVCGGNSVGV